MAKRKAQMSLLSMFGKMRKSHTGDPSLVSPHDPAADGEAPEDNDSLTLEASSSNPAPVPEGTIQDCTIPQPPQPVAAKAKYKRSFQHGWKKEFPWLLYNGQEDSVLCERCHEAGKAGLLAAEKRMDETFTSSGFSNWKKAKEKFENHENSRAHKLAVSQLDARKVPNKTAQMMLKCNELQLDSNTEALNAIFDVAEAIAVQGLPFRRRDEPTGNFRRMLDLASKYSGSLRAWLGCEKQNKHTFVSPQIQSEILKMMSVRVQKQLYAEIAAAGTYSVMVDETADFTGKEQVSMCFRFVDNEFVIHEVFAGLYEAPSTTAETISKIVLDVILRAGLDLHGLRGQCYDGAANMAGRYSGVQARLKEEEPRAVFVHCTAHRLNLVVQDVLNITALRDVIQEVGRLVKFYRDSPKRLANLKGTGQDTSLRPLCPTRWTCREGSLQSILDNYQPLLDSLEAMSKDSASRPDVGSTASGFNKLLQTFDFFWGLVLALHLLKMTTTVMTAVQGKSQSVAANLKMIQTLCMAVKGQREGFDAFWKVTLAKAEQAGVDEPRLKRAKRPPARLDDGAAPHVPPTPADAYRRIYFEAVDRLVAALDTRFNGDDGVLAASEDALLKAKPESIKRASVFYGLDEEKLTLHINMLHTCARGNGLQLNCLDDIVAAITDSRMELGRVVPECATLLKLVLTAPATTCTAERSFSLLRRLKSWLRSTLTQERLNHAAICATYPDAVMALDRAELLRSFIGKPNAAERHVLFRDPGSGTSGDTKQSGPGD